MSMELTDELERLRQMIFAVRRMLHSEDVEATLLLHQIAERILSSLRWLRSLQMARTLAKELMRNLRRDGP